MSKLTKRTSLARSAKHLVRTAPQTRRAMALATRFAKLPRPGPRRG